ncbi:YbjN domain-containing protein [Carnobacterium maltaromaticum]|uniref:YbjN domain-containing protein n=1 Tax=Carnobacterium maltaromaticum TaxID=2751 RepID=UPI00191BB0D6|nr:YbjN domain-containing protein [Carnobacterium maltaromaticum]CAD5903229.1 hypothetical protein CMALT394_70010 [Carnobacterium maltaromaticum]
MSNRIRLKQDVITYFRNNELNIENVEDFEDEKFTVIRIPVSLPSVPNSSFVVIIDDSKVQIYNFNVANNIQKNSSILEALNDLNIEYVFPKFYINGEDNVVCQQTLVSENLTVDTLVDLFQMLIEVNGKAFDEIMKAKYK